MENLNSPISALVEQYCELGAGFVSNKQPLYGGYRQFCLEEGLQPDSYEIFAKNLFAKFSQVRQSRNEMTTASRFVCSRGCVCVVRQRTQTT